MSSNYAARAATERAEAAERKVDYWQARAENAEALLYAIIRLSERVQEHLKENNG